MEDFLASRASEGANPKALIEQRLAGIQVEVKKVREHLPQIIEWQRQKLTDRLAEAKGGAGPSPHQAGDRAAGPEDRRGRRGWIAWRCISETNKILKKGGACGPSPRLHDAGVQPRVEHAGLQVINAEVTQSAVELKVLIEQMRESRSRTSSDPPLSSAPAPATRGFHVSFPAALSRLTDGNLSARGAWAHVARLPQEGHAMADPLLLLLAHPHPAQAVGPELVPGRLHHAGAAW